MSRRGGRALALDVGERRIGVALSDETGVVASPLAVVARGGRADDLAEIERLIDRWEVDRLVVGLPIGLSGREGPQAASVRAYAAALGARLGATLGAPPPIDFWDERLTTAIAERALIAAGARRAQRKERIDAVAAAVILQGYLDDRRRRSRAAAETSAV